MSDEVGPDTGQPTPGEPVAGQPVTEESGLKHAATMVGGGLGCLALLVGLAIVSFGALAIFLDDPTFWIAVAALVVAFVAYRATKRKP